MVYRQGCRIRVTNSGTPVIEMGANDGVMRACQLTKSDDATDLIRNENVGAQGSL